MGEVPEAVVSVYSDETLDLLSLKEACDFATVIVMGPGMGKSDHAKEIVKYVFDEYGLIYWFECEWIGGNNE